MNGESQAPVVQTAATPRATSTMTSHQAAQRADVADRLDRAEQRVEQDHGSPDRHRAGGRRTRSTARASDASGGAPADARMAGPKAATRSTGSIRPRLSLAGGAVGGGRERRGRGRATAGPIRQGRGRRSSIGDAGAAICVVHYLPLSVVVAVQLRLRARRQRWYRRPPCWSSDSQAGSDRGSRPCRPRSPSGEPRSSTPTPSSASCRRPGTPVLAAMVERFGRRDHRRRRSARPPGRGRHRVRRHRRPGRPQRHRAPGRRGRARPSARGRVRAATVC